MTLASSDTISHRRGVATSVDLLVVAAFAPELEPLAPRITVNGVVTSDGGVIAAQAIGIGLAQSCAGLARALEVFAPRAVLLIGSCGFYAGAPFAIGDVIVARSIALSDAAAMQGNAAFPGPMSTSCEMDASLVERLAHCGAKPARVANTLAITTDDALAASYRERGFEIEHLEAFALDVVPREIPCTALLGIANRVGSSARDEWKANAARAHRACAGVLHRWLETGVQQTGR